MNRSRENMRVAREICLLQTHFLLCYTRLVTSTPRLMNHESIMSHDIASVYSNLNRSRTVSRDIFCLFRGRFHDSGLHDPSSRALICNSNVIRFHVGIQSTVYHSIRSEQFIILISMAIVLSRHRWNGRNRFERNINCYFEYILFWKTFIGLSLNMRLRERTCIWYILTIHK